MNRCLETCTHCHETLAELSGNSMRGALLDAITHEPNGGEANVEITESEDGGELPAVDFLEPARRAEDVGRLDDDDIESVLVELVKENYRMPAEVTAVKAKRQI